MTGGSRNMTEHTICDLKIGAILSTEIGGRRVRYQFEELTGIPEAGNGTTRVVIEIEAEDGSKPRYRYACDGWYVTIFGIGVNYASNDAGNDDPPELPGTCWDEVWTALTGDLIIQSGGTAKQADDYLALEGPDVADDKLVYDDDCYDLDTDDGEEQYRREYDGEVFEMGAEEETWVVTAITGGGGRGDILYWLAGIRKSRDEVIQLMEESVAKYITEDPEELATIEWDNLKDGGIEVTHWETTIMAKKVMGDHIPIY
jgi:hypothetical protein